MRPSSVPAILVLASLCAFSHACASHQAPENISSSSTAATIRPPPPSAFTFGPGDRFSVKVWRHEELDMELTIAPDGGITFPLVGHLEVAGLTFPELVEILEDALDDYYKDVSVAVNIEEVTNQKVFVVGEVQNPSVLQVESDLSIIEALARTGGINSDARTSNVLLIRGGVGEPDLYTVDVESVYREGDFSQLVYLQQGDIVVVPSKTIVNVERFFRRIQGVLSPFVGGSAIYRNAVSGGAQGTSSALD